MKIKVTIDLAKALKPKTGIFSYLCLLTLTFIFFELCFSLKAGVLYLGDFRYISNQFHFPFSFFPSLFYFIFAFLGFHLLFTGIIWAASRLSGFALTLTWTETQTMSYWYWGLGIITSLLFNEVYFPNSKFSSLLVAILPYFFAKFLLIGAGFACLLVLFLSLFGLYFKIPYEKRLPACLSGAAVFILFFIFSFYPYSEKVLDASTEKKPNLIIIGIDSLRPDALGYFGKTKRSVNIDRFLQHSTVFSDAMTPIARTFPSWLSILTGLYPKHSGARYDLENPKNIQLKNTISNIVKAQGYQTIYATDETRFSNINQAYGFDQLINPPAGLGDFLLGTYNDFPLTNWVLNTRLGQYLFPFSYGNRPILQAYDPNTFIRMLDDQLPNQRKKPLLFAVHFCLPHFPYYWKHYAILKDMKTVDHYKAAVKRADRQFKDLMTLLSKKDLLRHSVIVLLSDHGEAIELNGDRLTDARHFIPGKNNPKHLIPRFYPPTYQNEAVNRSAGHGTDVLSYTQYHTVLAIQTRGIPQVLPHRVDERVSLLDIKPTLLQFLSMQDRTSDGHSLVPYLYNHHPMKTAYSDLYLESDFSPQAVRSIHPNLRNVLMQGMHFYQMDPVTETFTVKPNMGLEIIKSKQHAVIEGDWILALYPNPRHQFQAILVNLKNKNWTNDLNTDFAKKAPLQHMITALNQFFQGENAPIQRLS